MLEGNNYHGKKKWSGIKGLGRGQCQYQIGWSVRSPKQRAGGGQGAGSALVRESTYLHREQVVQRPWSGGRIWCTLQSGGFRA